MRREPEEKVKAPKVWGVMEESMMKWAGNLPGPHRECDESAKRRWVYNLGRNFFYTLVATSVCECVWCVEGGLLTKCLGTDARQDRSLNF